MILICSLHARSRGLKVALGHTICGWSVASSRNAAGTSYGANQYVRIDQINIASHKSTVARMVQWAVLLIWLFVFSAWTANSSSSVGQPSSSPRWDLHSSLYSLCSSCEVGEVSPSSNSGTARPGRPSQPGLPQVKARRELRAQGDCS